MIDIIDKDLPSKNDDNFKQADRIAKGVIVEYLSDSFIHYTDTDLIAKEILQKLDAIYERKSLAIQLALRKQLLQLKLQGDMSLVKHFICFVDLISALIVAGAKLEETDKVAHLLLTLPSSHDGVITAIETLTNDTLTLAFVKTRFLDHEVKL